MQRASKRKSQNQNEVTKQTKPKKILPWDVHLMIPKLEFWEAASIVFTVAVACFANSWDGDFVFDDSEAIINNKDVNPDSNLSSIFIHDFWGSKLSSKTSHKSYRPLTVLTFRWSYWLSGGLEPMWFHVPNIALHAIVCVLFLQVFSVILGGCGNKKLGFEAPRASFLAALLFATHPIHTECVSGVVGRADLLCALFVLLAFLAYVCSTLGDNATDDNEAPRSRLWLAASTICTVLAVGCKEIGITGLGLCSAYDILGHHRCDLLVLLGLRRRHTEVAVAGKCIKASIGRHLVLAATGVVTITLRMKLQGGAAPSFQVVDNPHSFVESFLLRCLNYQYLYALNGWLLVAPHWLCFDWSMGCVPVITTFSDPRLLTVLAFWLMLGSLFVWCFCRPVDNIRSIVLLGLAFLIVPFLPASNLLFRVGFVIAERILYLPSAGFIVLLVVGAARLSARSENVQQVVCVLYVVVLLLYSYKSFHRSREWKHEHSLFESGAKVCPMNAKVHYNLGKTYSDSGEIERGIDEYKLAIELNPQYDQAMNNLANIYKDQGKLTEAESLLEKAVGIRSDFAAAWMNLAIVQADLGKRVEAEASYRTALQHRHHYPDAYYNLGNLYLSAERHTEALTAWRNATLQNPHHVAAWGNMLLLLDGLRRFDEVDVVASEALLLNPSEAVLHYNYASALGKAEKYEESEKHFLSAIQLTPNVATYHTNLGILYHRWGRFDSAEDAYKTALDLDPTSTSIKEYLNMLYKKRDSL